MRRVPVHGWMFIVAVPLVACGGAGSSNAAIDAPPGDAPIDGRPPNTVVGKRVYVCHGPSGDLEIPGLNHFSTIEARPVRVEHRGDRQGRYGIPGWPGMCG